MIVYPTSMQAIPLGYTSTTSRLVVFSFTASPSTGIYTLSLHDALPIWDRFVHPEEPAQFDHLRRRHLDLGPQEELDGVSRDQDRKSTRLNSSHRTISYAVFCLKKKTNASNAGST